MVIGSRTIEDQSWAWWPEPLLLDETFGDDYHDMDDGRLVLRRSSAVRVAVAPGSAEFMQVDGDARVGSAGDDLFVWSQLLQPSGSRVRAWSREGGVVDVVHALPDDPCAVTASESHVVGITGVGRCTGFLRDLKFWRISRDELGNDSAVVTGPPIVAETRLGFVKLQAYGGYAALLIVPEVAPSASGKAFILIARFADETLWRVDPREGMSFGGTGSFTLTDTHLYTVEPDPETRLGYSVILRQPLSELESFATTFPSSP